MTHEELNKKAQKLMKDQNLSVCYATEDGNLFYEESFAKSHAVNKKIACMEIKADGKALATDEEEAVVEKKKKK